MKIGRKNLRTLKTLISNISLWKLDKVKSNLQVSVKVMICESHDLWQYSVEICSHSILYYILIKNLYSSYLDIVWKILLHFQSTARWEKGHDQNYQQTPYLKILTNKLHLQWLDLWGEKNKQTTTKTKEKQNQNQTKQNKTTKKTQHNNSKQRKVILPKQNPLNSVIFSLFSTQKSSDCKLLQNIF